MATSEEEAELTLRATQLEAVETICSSTG